MTAAPLDIARIIGHNVSATPGQGYSYWTTPSDEEAELLRNLLDRGAEVTVGSPTLFTVSDLEHGSGSSSAVRVSLHAVGDIRAR
jgi:hypothetical protein